MHKWIIGLSGCYPTFYKTECCEFKLRMGWHCFAIHHNNPKWPPRIRNYRIFKKNKTIADYNIIQLRRSNSNNWIKSLIRLQPIFKLFLFHENKI